MLKLKFEKLLGYVTNTSKKQIDNCTLNTTGADLICSIFSSSTLVGPAQLGYSSSQSYTIF